MSAPNSDYDPVEVTPLRADEVERMRDEALAAIAAADTVEALKQARLDHAGDRSPLALANREIGALPPQARKEAGQRVGQARGAVNDALAARTAEVEAAEEERMLAAERVDVTLPCGRRAGRLAAPAHHDLRARRRHLRRHGLGGRRGPRGRGRVAQLRRAEPRSRPSGPHHAGHVLGQARERERWCCVRTRRPVQARTMLTREPPIYIACPGRVFRTDELDATHSPVFHQVEGLAIDEGLSMAHLKGTLDHFAEAMFGEGTTTRFRPSYFPFTEPSAEVDLLCHVCRNEPGVVDDCRTCKGEGWIEWGGCGVVNPRVLIACGVDPERYSGFAFGMGLDRTITGRYEIADLRDLFDGDIRFTEPFGVGL